MYTSKDKLQVTRQACGSSVPAYVNCHPIVHLGSISRAIRLHQLSKTYSSTQTLQTDKALSYCQFIHTHCGIDTHTSPVTSASYTLFRDSLLPSLLLQSRAKCLFPLCSRYLHV